MTKLNANDAHYILSLAGLFAIEVCGYSVMSNHLHLVLRNRPDIAEEWSADEIARRWCRIFPPGDDATSEPVEPGVHDLAMLANNSGQVITHTTILSIRLAADRLEPPNVDALVDCSY